MNRRQINLKGVGLLFWGLLITMGSVYVENGTGIFEYSYDPKVAGMLIDNFGMFVITLGALLIGITVSKQSS